MQIQIIKRANLLLNKLVNVKKRYKIDNQQGPTVQHRELYSILYNNLMVVRGEGAGEGTVREFGMHTYTLLYLKWVTNKDLLYSTGNPAQYHVTI